MFSSWSINRKISSAIIAFITIIAVFIMIYVPQQLEKMAMQAMSNKAEIIADLTTFSISPSVYFQDGQTLAENLTTLRRMNDISFFVVVNDRGAFLHSMNDSLAQRYHFLEYLDTARVTPDGAMYVIDKPIWSGRYYLGHLTIGFSLSSVMETVVRSRASIILLSLLIIAFGALAAYGIGNIITKPLRLVVETTQKISNGDFFQRAPVVTKDEVGNLAQSFNVMVEKLVKALNDLAEINQTLEQMVSKRTEALQKEMDERLKSEEHLRASEERYRTFVGNILEGVFRVELDPPLSIDTPVPNQVTAILERGIIAECNDVFAQMYGFSKAEELYQKRLGSLWDSNDPSNIEHLSAFVLGQYNLKDSEALIKDRRAQLKAFVNNIIGIVENNMLVRCWGTQRDVTQHKLLEEQLRHSQKMESIGTLAAGIAHDFNNILAIILGYATMLKEQWLTSTTEIEKSADSILQAAQRGSNLVRQLLTVARKSKVETVPMDINELIASVRILAEQTFPKTITFDLELQENLPQIVADPTQLQQVVLNLCVNARDAMESGGKIAIGTLLRDRDAVRLYFPSADASSYILLTVADTGIGMDETTRSRIFEPFFTTKAFGKGVGLGLPLVYGIIERHHGFINVDSVPGKGTLFSIYLPVSTAYIPAFEKGDEQAKDSTRGKETVLVVEDEELLVNLLTHFLVENGYTVIVGRDGQQGLEMYRQNHSSIDLVISDYGLPRLDGRGVLKGIKELNPAIPVIIASGFLNPELQTEMMKDGATEFVRKPYNPKDMLRIIRRILDRHPFG